MINITFIVCPPARRGYLSALLTDVRRGLDSSGHCITNVMLWRCAPRPRRAWSLEAWSSRSQTEPHRKHSAAFTCTYCLSKARLSRVEQQGTDRAAGSSAQRCFYLYILFVKGAGLSRELFFDVYSISASSFFFTIKYREYTLEFSGPLFLPP